MKNKFLQIDKTRYYIRFIGDRYFVHTTEVLEDGSESSLVMEYADKSFQKILDYFHEDFEEYEIREILDL